MLAPPLSLTDQNKWKTVNRKEKREKEKKKGKKKRRFFFTSSPFQKILKQIYTSQLNNRPALYSKACPVGPRLFGRSILHCFLYQLVASYDSANTAVSRCKKKIRIGDFIISHLKKSLQKR